MGSLENGRSSQGLYACLNNGKIRSPGILNGRQSDELRDCPKSVPRVQKLQAKRFSSTIHGRP